MKRDWECVREILLQLEALPDASSVLNPRDVQGWAPEIVSEHLRLLEEAGLARVKCQTIGSGGLFCLGFGLTWSGHELLGAMRKPEGWNHIKAVAMEKGVALSLDVIRSLAAWVLKQAMHGGCA